MKSVIIYPIIISYNYPKLDRESRFDSQAVTTLRFCHIARNIHVSICLKFQVNIFKTLEVMTIFLFKSETWNYNNLKLIRLKKTTASCIKFQLE